MNNSFIFVFSGFIFTQGPAVPENCLGCMFAGSISQTLISHRLKKKSSKSLYSSLTLPFSLTSRRTLRKFLILWRRPSFPDPYNNKFQDVRISLTKEPIWIQGDTFLPAVIFPDQPLTAETSSFSKEDTSFPLGLCNWKCLTFKVLPPKHKAWQSVIEEHGLDRVAKLTSQKKKLYYRIQTRDSMVCKLRKKYMTIWRRLSLGQQSSDTVSFIFFTCRYIKVFGNSC